MLFWLISTLSKALSQIGDAASSVKGWVDGRAEHEEAEREHWGRVERALGAPAPIDDDNASRLEVLR